MKEIQKQNKRRFLWLLVVVPILGVILLGSNNVRDMVVVPVEYNLWLAKQALKAIPQYVFWAIFCGIYLVVIVHSLMSGNKQPIRLREEDGSNARADRVAFWANQIRMQRGGSFSRLRFAEFFSRLILDILIYTGDIKLAQVDEELRTGKLDLPDELMTYLKIRSMRLSELRSPKLLPRIKRWITQLFSSKNPNISRENKNSQNSLIEPNLLFSVNYLEKELEVDTNRNENR